MSTTIRSLSIFLLVASLLCSLAFAPLVHADPPGSKSSDTGREGKTSGPGGGANSGGGFGPGGGSKSGSAGGSKGYSGGPNAGGNAGGAQTGSKGYQGGPNAGGNAGGMQTGGNGGGYSGKNPGGDREGKTSGPGGGANSGGGFGPSNGGGTNYSGGPNAGGNAGGMQTGGSAPTKSAMSMARDAFSSAQRAVGNAISGIAKSIGSIATNQSTPAGEIAKGIRNAMQSLGISPSDVNTFSGLPSGYTAPTSITDKALSEIGVTATPNIVGALNENNVSVINTPTTGEVSELDKAFAIARERTLEHKMALAEAQKYGVAGALPADLANKLQTTAQAVQEAEMAVRLAQADPAAIARAAQQDTLDVRKETVEAEKVQSIADAINAMTANSFATPGEQASAEISGLENTETDTIDYEKRTTMMQSIAAINVTDRAWVSAVESLDMNELAVAYELHGFITTRPAQEIQGVVDAIAPLSIGHKAAGKIRNKDPEVTINGLTLAQQAQLAVTQYNIKHGTKYGVLTTSGMGPHGSARHREEHDLAKGKPGCACATDVSITDANGEALSVAANKDTYTEVAKNFVANTTGSIGLGPSYMKNAMHVDVANAINPNDKTYQNGYTAWGKYGNEIESELNTIRNNVEKEVKITRNNDSITINENSTAIANIDNDDSESNVTTASTGNIPGGTVPTENKTPTPSELAQKPTDNNVDDVRRPTENVGESEEDADIKEGSVIGKVTNAVRNAYRSIVDSFRGLFGGGSNNNSQNEQPNRDSGRVIIPPENKQEVNDGKLDIDDIESIIVNFGLGIGCKEDQGTRQNGYEYSVTLKNTSNTIENEGCGLQTPTIYAQEIAEDLIESADFTIEDPNELMKKMTFNFYSEQIN